MRGEPDAEFDAFVAAVAVARLIMPLGVSVQAPPNLAGELDDSASAAQDQALLLRAGIDDWGGVSPVTPDHVNPERPWPGLDALRQVTGAAGFTLTPRLTIYPRYVRDPNAWLHPDLVDPVTALADQRGLARERQPSPAPDDRCPMTAARPLRARPRGERSRRPVRRGLRRPARRRRRGARGPGGARRRGAARGGRRPADVRRQPQPRHRGRPRPRARRGARRRGLGARGHRGVRAGPAAARRPGPRAARAPRADHGPRAAARPRLPSRRGRRRRRAAWASRRASSSRPRATPGSGSVPGTAARILDDDIRARLTGGTDIPAARWIELITTAHEVGLRSTATMVYGHVETPADQVAHLRTLAAIQDRTGGFTEMIAMPIPPAALPAGGFLTFNRQHGPHADTTRETRALYAVDAAAAARPDRPRAGRLAQVRSRAHRGRPARGCRRRRRAAARRRPRPRPPAPRRAGR